MPVYLYQHHKTHVCSQKNKLKIKNENEKNAGYKNTYTRIHIHEKNVEVHGDVVHADQGCHGQDIMALDVNFSIP